MIPEANALFDPEDEEEVDENEHKPLLGEYWKVRNGVHFLFAQISNENPLEVKYFEPSVKGNFHSLNENPFDVCLEDLQEKIEPPEIIKRGKYRKFYLFE